MKRNKALLYLNARFTNAKYKVYIRSGADWATTTATTALRIAAVEPAPASPAKPCLYILAMIKTEMC